MEKINIEVTKEELVLIIGGMIKLQMSMGIENSKLIELSTNLTLQAMDKITLEELNEMLESASE